MIDVLLLLAVWTQCGVSAAANFGRYYHWAWAAAYACVPVVSLYTVRAQSDSFYWLFVGLYLVIGVLWGFVAERRQRHGS